MWAGKGGGGGGYYVTASASLMHTKGRFKYFFPHFTMRILGSEVHKHVNLLTVLPLTCINTLAYTMNRRRNKCNLS